MSVSGVVRDAAMHEGKTVQVKGKVTEVCQMMGCWMNLVDPSSGQSIRVKVNDGEIVFPKDAPGRMAIAEGKLKKIVLTREQATAMAQHEAEEQGRKFDPAAIKTGKTFYQIQGTGAVLLD
jgi:NMD protein affecting ribosome stability and mRNA decay